MSNNLEGVPEGVVPVRFGMAGEQDFWVCGHNAVRQGRSNQPVLIVQPGEKHEFVYNIATDEHQISKQTEPTLLQPTFRFTSTVTMDYAKAAIMRIPGFVGFREPETK